MHGSVTEEHPTPGKQTNVQSKGPDRPNGNESTAVLNCKSIAGRKGAREVSPMVRERRQRSEGKRKEEKGQGKSAVSDRPEAEPTTLVGRQIIYQRAHQAPDPDGKHVRHSGTPVRRGTQRATTKPAPKPADTRGGETGQHNRGQTITKKYRYHLKPWGTEVQYNLTSSFILRSSALSFRDLTDRAFDMYPRAPRKRRTRETGLLTKRCSTIMKNTYKEVRNAIPKTQDAIAALSGGYAQNARLVAIFYIVRISYSVDGLVRKDVT